MLKSALSDQSGPTAERGGPSEKSAYFPARIPDTQPQNFNLCFQTLPAQGDFTLELQGRRGTHRRVHKSAHRWSHADQDRLAGCRVVSIWTMLADAYRP